MKDSNNAKRSRRFNSEHNAINFSKAVKGKVNDLRGNTNNKSNFKVSYTKGNANKRTDLNSNYGSNVDTDFDCDCGKSADGSSDGYMKFD